MEEQQHPQQDKQSEQQRTQQPQETTRQNTEEKPSRLKRFIKEALRVLRITKKPDKEEYKSLVKVTGIGAAVLGIIGFILFLFKQLLF